MNYLAHFHLAGSNPGLQVGALLGDYVKGPLQSEWPTDIEQGIKLHRRIDGFSDRHRVQKALKEFLPIENHRYRGILFDVFCDLYLTTHWSSFSQQALPEYAQNIYLQLDNHQQDFPIDAQQQAWRLQHFDALCCFSEVGAVLATIDKIAERLKEKDKLINGAKHFADQVDKIEQLFLDFYPELILFSEQEKINFCC